MNMAKQGQLEKLTRLQSGNYTKIEFNWIAVGIVAVLIIGYVIFNIMK